MGIFNPGHRTRRRRRGRSLGKQLVTIYQDNTIEFNKELKDIIKELDKLDTAFSRKVLKRTLKQAAKPMLEAARNNIRDSKQTHYRWRGGERVAAYRPGHLRKTVRILPFRKSPDIFIGPKKTKGRKSRVQASKIYDGVTLSGSDAYYAWWIERGVAHMKNNPGKGFLRKAFDSKKGAVEASILRNLNNRLKRTKKKLESGG